MSRKQRKPRPSLPISLSELLINSVDINELNWQKFWVLEDMVDQLWEATNKYLSHKQRLRTSSSLLGHGAPRETDL